MYFIYSHPASSAIFFLPFYPFSTCKGLNHIYVFLVSLFVLLANYTDCLQSHLCEWWWVLNSTWILSQWVHLQLYNWDNEYLSLIIWKYPIVQQEGRELLESFLNLCLNVARQVWYRLNVGNCEIMNVTTLSCSGDGNAQSSLSFLSWILSISSFSTSLSLLRSVINILLQAKCSKYSNFRYSLYFVHTLISTFTTTQ